MGINNIGPSRNIVNVEKFDEVMKALTGVKESLGTNTQQKVQQAAGRALSNPQAEIRQLEEQKRKVVALADSFIGNDKNVTAILRRSIEPVINLENEVLGAIDSRIATLQAQATKRPLPRLGPEKTDPRYNAEGLGEIKAELFRLTTAGHINADLQVVRLSDGSIDVVGTAKKLAELPLKEGLNSFLLDKFAETPATKGQILLNNLVSHHLMDQVISQKASRKPESFNDPKIKGAVESAIKNCDLAKCALFCQLGANPEDLSAKATQMGRPEVASFLATWKRT